MERVKNKFSNLKLLIGGADYAKMIEDNRQKFVDLFLKNIFKTITLIFVIYCIYFYLRYIRNRVKKLLGKSYNKYISGRTIARISQNAACNMKLCDAYVASSAKSYLPGNQKYDYSSELAIVNAIKLGARFLELDVYAKNFCPSSNPVVTNGKEVGNWHYTTTVSFDTCCRAIAHNAFNREVVTNFDDPLFIYLNLNLNGYNITANKVVAILYKYFGKILYSLKDDIYSPSVTDLRFKTMMSFVGKVVIFTNSTEYYYAGTGSYTLGNIVSGTPYDSVNKTGSENMIEYTNNGIEDVYDLEQSQQDHKISLAFVFPEFKGRKTQNYKPALAYSVGCQFIAMNYQHVDDNMDFYLYNIFKTSSFIEKPTKLRYQETVIKTSYNMDTPSNRNMQNTVATYTGTM